MMMAQQSNDDVEPFTYPRGTAEVPATRSASVESDRDNSSRTSVASPSNQNKKRKALSSPTTEAGADGSANSPDKKEQAPKKSRRELSPHTVAILKGWMLSREHVKHPYPTDEDKQMLLKKTGISMKQLTNWFTNARKRIWKPMMRREHSGQHQSVMEFEHPAVREFPGAGRNQQYADSSYAAPSVIRHSFDAGSHGTGVLDRFVRPQAFPVGTTVYPPRLVRSMSEALERTDANKYLDTERFRKPNTHETLAPRNSLSPRGHNILQEWVNANKHREYPYPSEAERLQLARDTGLDVSQVDGWVTNFLDQMVPPPGCASSIPSAENPLFPQPLTYGERRSIPTSGNPMFPPRPTSSMRPSIPFVGNPRFPPPPMRRKVNESSFPAFSSTSSHYSHELPRGRSMTVSASPYLHPSNEIQAQSTNGALPSLSSRNLLSAEPPVVTTSGPTMGQPRDSRSRTLDMGQFTEARRRRMNFQDILASTGEPTVNAVSAAPACSAMFYATCPTLGSSNNMENVYLNRSAPSTAAYPTLVSTGFRLKHSAVSSEEQPGRVV